MRLSPVFLYILTLLTLETTYAAHVLHEKRSDVPTGWSLVRRHRNDQVLPLRFGLKQANIDRIDELLNDIAHPDSPNYGKHWTPEQVASTFTPTSETIDTVAGWLLGSGFDRARLRFSPSNNWILVNATVSEAETLLKTKYNLYQHDSGEQHIACTEYHLPDHISPHIDLVTPSIHFDAILKKRGPISLPARSIGQPGVGRRPKTTGPVTQLVNALDTCDIIMTPDCLRSLYNITNFQFRSTSSNTFAIAEYTPQAYIASDLDMFAKNFSTNLVGKRPKLVSIDGGTLQSMWSGFEYNGESNLDVQYAMSLVNPTGGSFNNLLDAFDASYCTFQGGDDFHQDGIYPDTQFYPNGYGSKDCGITKPPNVIATSYGYNEIEISPAYAARQCTEYAKLGMMGVTVLYSSGDNGVAGNSAFCVNESDGRESTDGTIFNPGFPSTCPYVTSIGATQMNAGAKVTDPESACQTVIYSGGGFSNQFAMPGYQKAAVQSYLQNHKPDYPAVRWNSTGTSRGFPDMAANGANYIIATNGQFGLVYGTSAATPVVGAMLTMINDARIAAGKKPIGFINPTIYSSGFADAFNDIVSGNNQGCGTAGFATAPGWDPVTGLGTPSFNKLLSKWLALP